MPSIKTDQLNNFLSFTKIFSNSVLMEGSIYPFHPSILVKIMVKREIYLLQPLDLLTPSREPRTVSLLSATSGREQPAKETLMLLLISPQL